MAGIVCKSRSTAVSSSAFVVPRPYMGERRKVMPPKKLTSARSRGVIVASTRVWTFSRLKSDVGPIL